MLTRLHISNYALIDELVIEPAAGMTVITGETGAGKSIILGAMAMILGARADLSVLSNKSRKCIIEAEFSLHQYDLEPLFQIHDLDYSLTTIVRREISSDGKSRAFVNDTPVNLTILRELGSKLIDIHSQHETLTLNNSEFQLHVLDSLAGSLSKLDKYKEAYNLHKTQSKLLKDLLDEQARLESESGYNKFLLEELEAAQLKEGELESLESEQRMLDGAIDLQAAIANANRLLTSEPNDVVAGLHQIIHSFQPLEKTYPFVNEWLIRLRSVSIELKDLASEIERGTELVGFDPERSAIVNERTDLLNRLMRKHRSDTVDKLIELREQLSKKMVGETSLDDNIRITRIEVDKLSKTMIKLADEMHSMREKAIPSVRKKVVELAREIGLKNSEFHIRLTILPEGTFRQNGRDAIEFLFSANKGSEPQALDKVASGGELSRLMLCIKSLLAEKSGLPTLVFDEIDTGVSGEIAHKIGSLIHEMSNGRQVFVITHLPQMAAHGDDHFLVSKKTTGNKTNTNLVRLSKNERVDELARMLSGEILTEAAKANARDLLKSSR